MAMLSRAKKLTSKSKEMEIFRNSTQFLKVGTKISNHLYLKMLTVKKLMAQLENCPAVNMGKLKDRAIQEETQNKEDSMKDKSGLCLHHLWPL